MSTSSLLESLRPLTLLAIATLLSACAPSDEGSTGGDASPDQPNADSGEVITLQGRLGQETSATRSDLMITAYEVERDGSQSELGHASVASDDSYTLQLPWKGALQGTHTLLLMVSPEGERDTHLGSLVFSAELSQGASYMLAPIDQETSAECSIYVDAANRGLLCESCSAEDVRAVVTDDLATAIALNDANQDDVTTTVMAGLKAQEEMLRAEEITAEQLDDARVMLRQAQRDFDAALSSSEDTAMRQNARANYERAYMDAYLDVGISADKFARAEQAKAEAVWQFSERLDSEVAGSLILESEHARAMAVSQHIAESYGAMKGGNDFALMLGEQLQLELQSLDPNSSTLRQQITSAWEDYQDAIEAELRADMSLTAQAALDTVFATVMRARDDYASRVANVGADVEVGAHTIVSAQEDLDAEITSDGNIATLMAVGSSAMMSERLLDITFQLSAATATR